MRIISGKYGRRNIRPPKDLPVRPTTDMAKESLFNILSNKIDFENKSALDLFAGTGSIAFEFVSRGCQPVVAVDKNFQCIQFIKKAGSAFGMEDLQAIRTDVFRYIQSTSKKFDLIFADPPYALESIETINQLVFENKLLNKDGWLIVEHPREIDFSEQDYFVEHRKYGKVNFSFFTQD
ncbi:MAG: 16S rRNA (guanine(966)-N(2))-methyltransferase RsmD [Bacteroidetes bacterium]|nr:MAG: 16S rRNA (guanine(966)-N(2))-methyltransferase RsmD [Bacteroidota bacterium]